MFFIRKSVVVFLAIAFGVSSKAQEMSAFKAYGDLTPSVNSYEMKRYGTVSHSLYTGAMTYSIPLFTYADPEVNLPISLNYHYDGFRPATCSGEVGLGWDLDLGGVITREICGVPDEGGFNDCDVVTIQGYWEAVRDHVCRDTTYVIRNSRLDEDVFGTPQWNIAGDIDSYFDPFRDFPCFYKGGAYYETAPDVFHFNVAGMTGDFSLMPDGSVAVYNSNVPRGELNIEFTPMNEPLEHQYLTITITAGDGTKYIFGESPYANEYSEYANEYTIESGSSSTDGNMSITAAKLSRIIPPNGRQIVFNYADSTLISTSAFTSRKSHVTSCSYGGYTINLSESPQNVSSAQRQYYSPLASISVDGRTMASFSYLVKELDECASNYFESERIDEFFMGQFHRIMSPRRLSSVTVYNSSSEIVEKIDLFHSYSISGTPKMFLDSLHILSSGTFSMIYHSRDSLPLQDTKCTDYWGYWNDTPASFYNLYRAGATQFRQFTDSLMKKPSLARTLKGALKSIKYPTGGFSKIYYEQNTARVAIMSDLRTNPHLVDVPSGSDIGGLRVRRTVDFYGDDSTSVVFSYNEPSNSELSSGVVTYIPRYLFFDSFSYHMGGLTAYYDLESFSLGSKANRSNSPFITYGSVRKQFQDGSYSVMNFNTYRTHPDNYVPLEFGEYTLKKTVKHLYSSSDVYHYTYGDPELDEISGVCRPVIDDYSCIRGKVASELSYDSSGVLKQRRTYTYTMSIAASSDYIWYNNITNFIGARKKYRCADPTSVSTTEYFPSGASTYDFTSKTYNQQGQISSVAKATGHNGGVYRNNVFMRYTSSTNPSVVPGLLADAVKTIIRDSIEYVIAAEHYDYYANGNPHPSKIITYEFENPVILSNQESVYDFSSIASGQSVSHFSYDDKFRLTETRHPGGAITQYEWTGNNISAKVVNGNGNKALFEWKDMVGPTIIISPSGQSESYLYDSRNRLWRVRDSELKTVTEYHLYLVNE